MATVLELSPRNQRTTSGVKMSAKMTWLFTMTTVGLVAFFGWKLTARAAYESADYTVIESDGEFEIREYPELTLVTTGTEFEQQGGNGSFMRLFRYISGANESKRNVAMTTPVFMRPRTEATDGQMAFVIPKRVAAEGAPKPAGQNVELQKRPGGKFAVIRFSGRMSSDAYAQAEQRLRGWLTNRGFTALSEAESAGYDPPWTPGPLRRNEVLIRIQ